MFNLIVKSLLLLFACLFEINKYVFAIIYHEQYAFYYCSDLALLEITISFVTVFE